MKLKHGFIGTKEYELAKEELENSNWKIDYKKKTAKCTQKS